MPASLLLRFGYRRVHSLLLLGGMLASLAVPAAAAAQATPRFSGSAAVQLTVVVPPALTIAAIRTLRREVTGGIAAVTSHVEVAGNLPHRLVARTVAGEPVEVRRADGAWIPVRGTEAVELGEFTGRGTHVVQCRARSTAACGLQYELHSTDGRFPLRVSGYDAQQLLPAT